MPATSLCNFAIRTTLHVTACDSTNAIAVLGAKLQGAFPDGSRVDWITDDLTVEHLDGIVPPALRTLDGQPLDPASLTLGQVVESSYAHANGDIDDWDEFVAADDVSSSEYFAGGDTLAEYLLQELVEGPIADSDGVEDIEAWTEARRRADRTLAEVQSVRDALHRFGPQS